MGGRFGWSDRWVGSWVVLGGVTGGLGLGWFWVESLVGWVIGGFGWSHRWVGSWVDLGGVTGGLGHRWIWVE